MGEIVTFPRNVQYKIGNVIYDVTVHFDENGETLKDKIKNLLIEEIHKKNSFQTLAQSHSDSV